MLRVGLVGCGAIGSRLAHAVERTYRHVARLSALHDTDAARARRLGQALPSHPPVVSLTQLIRRSRLVIEAASSQVSGRVAVLALRAHRDVLVMSTGGLLEDLGWRRAAARSRGRVYIPSGALAGLDGVKAMARGGRITRVRLTTRKPPRALQEAPYVRARGITLSGLRRPRVLFEGSPSQAVRAFPQNTNVAATLALASGVPESRLRVRVVADPSLRRNVHELEVEGDCGRLACRIESIPSANPKTSEVAVRSALAALDGLLSSVHIGT